MLKHISIRTVIVVFLICNFTTINIIFLLPLSALIKLVMLNIVSVLRSPAHGLHYEVSGYADQCRENSIDEVNAGNLSVRIGIW